MKTTILSELIDADLNNKLKSCFEKSNIKFLTRSNREKVDFRIISLSQNDTDEGIRNKLDCKDGSHFIIFSDGHMNGRQLELIFSGRTICLHHRFDTEEIQECVNRVLDKLFLDEYLKDIQDTPPPSFELLADTAICIIDRSYRNVYVNERHKNNTPGPNMMYGLCWQQHRNLFDRAKPCNGCPAKRLFDNNMIPDPQYRVRKKAGQQDVTCSRLQVLPITDDQRDRIVASLEISLDVDPVNYKVNRAEQDKMIESCLDSVLDEGFTRSRVFRYIAPTKSLKGYKERYVDPAGEITADFTKVILPVDQYDKTVFENKQSVSREHVPGEIMERLYEEIFQKEKAPYWAEFPLIGENSKLGKLITDRFHPHDTEHKPVTDNERENVLPYALFIQQLLENMNQIEAVEIADALLACQKNVINKVLSPSSASSALETMLEWIPKYMKGIVCSAYLRILDDKSEQLILSPLFSVSGVKQEVVKPIDLDDHKKISSVVYKAQMPLAKLLSEEELKNLSGCYSDRNVKVEAKCSIPLAVRGMKYVLCLQGTKRLLNPNVIECLDEIANVAAIYNSPMAHSIGKSVLVLGPDTELGLKRIREISDILKEKKYESVLVKDRPDVWELSILDKARLIAYQSRFVIAEDSTPSGHIAEVTMCASNRMITAILREEGAKATHLLEHYPFDHNFISEFEYKRDSPKNDSLNEAVESAIIWAENLIEERIKYFKERYEWRQTYDPRNTS